VAGRTNIVSDIVGRDRERAALAAVVRAGGGLLLRGEPGAGKTVLLDETAAAAHMRVLRTAGVETTADIPYGAIAELIRPLRADLRTRPGAGPLRAALGMESATGGLSALAIEVAFEDFLLAYAPLLVIVDDVQWLDDASERVIGRLARGAGDLDIAVLLAARPGSVAARGVEELSIGGLDADTAASLLTSVDPDLAPTTVAALVAMTKGNPLGLLEFPRTLSPAERAGRESIRPGTGVTTRLVAAFADRLRRLPAPARLATIAAAAADPVDGRVLPVAFKQLGLAPDALDAAELDGLLHLTDTVSFRHPLVRIAVLGDAAADERRRVEAALAAVVPDVERRGWHRAAATSGTDDALADELETIADAAAVRIAYATQVRLLGEAARLTGSPSVRAKRLVDAAYAAFRSGSLQRSEELLAAAEVTDPVSIDGTAGLLVRSRLLRWHGEIGPLVDILERAAARSDQAPAGIAVTVRREAAIQRLMVADPDPAVAHAAAALRRAGDDPWLRFIGHEAAAMAAVQAGNVDAAIGHCHEAVRLVDAGYGHPDYVVLLGNSLTWCELYADGHRLLTGSIERQRRASNPRSLAVGLENLGQLLRRTGRLAAAEAAGAEALDIAERLEDPSLVPLCATLVAHVRLLRGDRAAIGLAERAAAVPSELGNRVMIAPALAQGRLLAGDPNGALAALAPVIEVEPDGYREPNEIRGVGLRLEALVALDRRDEAAQVLAQVSAGAAGSSTRWTKSCAARFRGVLAADRDAAEEAFGDALATLRPADGPIEPGLIRLDYGRWLRRAGQRRAARDALQRAHGDFAACGAEALAEIAAREIGATAAKLRPRTAATNVDLTVREAEIASRAAAGLSDREIAAESFISVRTVDFHLRNVFRKLGVRSRAELAARLNDITRESSGR